MLKPFKFQSEGPGPKRPFGFQESFITNLSLQLRASRRVLGVAATGFGKGVVIAEIVARAMKKNPSSNICIAVHRIEIFNQVFDNLKAFGITAHRIDPDTPFKGASGVHLAMVETLCLRLKRGAVQKEKDLLSFLAVNSKAAPFASSFFNFLIADEVHYGSFFKLIDGFEGYVLGFTATPKSTGKPELNCYFDCMVEGLPISQLIMIKRLVPARTFTINHDFSHVKPNSKGTEFDDKAIEEEFNSSDLFEGAVRSYHSICPNAPALCFSASVQRSLIVCQQLLDLGYKAEHVNGKTSDEERLAIFDRYRQGVTQVICNVGIATTGTDLPTTRCVILDLATMSLVKYVQMVGRGGRCSPNKKDFVVIDMGRNCFRFGCFGEDIDWRAIFEEPKKAIVKREKRDKRECSECGAVIKFSLTKCPYCCIETPRKTLDTKAMLEMTAEEIKQYRKETLPAHLRKPLNSMSYNELKEYGRFMGLSFKWAHIRWAHRQNKNKNKTIL